MVSHNETDSLGSAGTVEVPVTTLDTALNGALVVAIKIDVEGFERQVLEGSTRTLQSTSLLGLIVELNGSGRRYGYEDSEVHEALVNAGFSPVRYAPASREISLLTQPNSTGNTLYARDLPAVRQRVKEAGKFRVRGQAI